MKYLDHPLLTHLSTTLSSNPSPEARVNVRFETYSIKPVAAERKKFKEMEDLYVSGQEEMEEMSFSPEMREAGLTSCFGRLDVKESRKAHFLLVSTLNSAFPDHDFSSLRPDHFTREPSASQVLSHISGSLLGAVGGAAKFGPTGLLSPPNSFSQLHQPSRPSFQPSSVPSESDLPNLAGGSLNDPSVIRILEDAIGGPLRECDAYSWLPEPEYDPHNETEEGEEASEDGLEYEDDSLELSGDGMEVEMDGDYQASWGQAGMELDDVPESQEVVTNSAPVGVGNTKGKKMRRSSGMDGVDLTSSPYLTPVDGQEEWDGERRVGGLLWSANYFFYSKRQKRILFLTCWCRKRPSFTQSPPDQVNTSFPLPISASLTSPPNLPTSLSPTIVRQPRAPRANHNRSNARPSHRKAIKKMPPTGKSITSSTIPIRGMTTPTSNRLASSAPNPTGFTALHSHLGSPSPSSTLARMSQGGFRPRQTPARLALNAAAMSRDPGGAPSPTSGTVKQGNPASATASQGLSKSVTGSGAGPAGPIIKSGISAGKAAAMTGSSASRTIGLAAASAKLGSGEDLAQRIRKERSESTPSTGGGGGGSLGLVEGLVDIVDDGIGKGKRVKV